MYLVIFFWSAALKSLRTLRSSPSEELPFGLIFSSFMCAMMAGSSIFNLRNTSRDLASTSQMLMAVTALMSCCLSLAVFVHDEYLVFWLFCLVEGCVGAYYPAMAYLKSRMIEYGIRGTNYSAMRFPLNAFVVIAHSLDEEGTFPTGW